MTDPPIIPPDVVGLPPMDTGRRHRDQDQDNPKGKRHRRQTGNRFAVLNSFIDMTAGGLTRAELLTWLVLYRDTKSDGTARTAQGDIARRAGVSDRSVRFALKRLAAFGLVRVVWQGGFRKGASVYAVEPLPEHTPKGPSLAGGRRKNRVTCCGSTLPPVGGNSA